MKTIIFISLLIAVSLASPLEELKAIVRNDQCALDGLESIRPQIHNQVQKLKQVISYLILESRQLTCQS